MEGKRNLAAILKLKGSKFNYSNPDNPSIAELQIAAQDVRVNEFITTGNLQDETIVTKDNYFLPEGFKEWGENFAYAYEVARQFQKDIDNGSFADAFSSGRYTSRVNPDIVYKGFYMLEYSLGTSVGYNESINKYYISLSKGENGEAYLLGLKTRQLIEWGEDETEPTKNAYFTLDEIPDNGRLFVFALFQDDEYTTTIKKMNYSEVLVLGGHPYSVTTTQETMFNEGIIQLNKTGEELPNQLPSGITDSDLYIIVNDQLHMEKSVLFNATIDNATELTNIPLTFDENTHVWYYKINGSNFNNWNIKIGNYIVASGQEEKTSGIILNTDGYEITIATDTNIYDHKGTDYTLTYPLCNGIYTRQFRGKFVSQFGGVTAGYPTCVSMPYYVKHGLCADGTTADGGKMFQSNWGRNRRIDLRNLRENTAGTLVEAQGFINELEFPELVTNNGTIVNNAASLYHLSLPKLKTSTGTICSNCNKLTLLDIPELETISIINCSVINLNAPKAKWTCGASREYFMNVPFLKTCNLPLLKGQIRDEGESLKLLVGSTASTLEEIVLPEFLNTRYQTYHGCMAVNFPELKRIIMPKYIHNGYAEILSGCPKIEEIYIPCSKTIANVSYNGNTLKSLSNLKKFTSGDLMISQYNSPTYESFLLCPNLIHLEGISIANFNFPKWDPTNAYNSNLSDLIEDSDKFTNNKQQFLYNFKTYIIERLVDRSKTSKLTMTLNANVYNIVTTETDFLIDNITPYNEWLIAKLAEINWSMASA